MSDDRKPVDDVEELKKTAKRHRITILTAKDREPPIAADAQAQRRARSLGLLALAPDEELEAYGNTQLRSGTRLTAEDVQRLRDVVRATYRSIEDENPSERIRELHDAVCPDVRRPKG